MLSHSARWSSSLDAVVAEQVRVGQHDDAPLAVLGGRRSAGAPGAEARRVRTGEDRAPFGAPIRRRRGTGTRSRTRRAGRPRVPRAARSARARRGSRSARPRVLVVLDGVVVELQPEPCEQLVEVVAVLLLLGLAEHDRARRRRARTPRSRRAPTALSRGEPEPVVRSQFGLRRVRDHEQVAAVERPGVERAARRWRATTKSRSASTAAARA